MEIKTRDLWQSAYLLSKGGELKGVVRGGPPAPGLRRAGNGSRMVLFIFVGSDVGDLAQEFQSGRAICNVARLRASMIHLKEIMFSRING